MRLFWLVIAIALSILITYLCLTQGFNKWGFYYVFVLISFGMFFFKSYMMKRMEKHLQYLEEQRQKANNTTKN